MMKDRVRSDKLEIWSCAKLPARIPAVRHLYDENMTFFKTIESVILKYGYLTDFEISLLVENMGFRNANISRWSTQQGYWICMTPHATICRIVIANQLTEIGRAHV